MSETINDVERILRQYYPRYDDVIWNDLEKHAKTWTLDTIRGPIVVRNRNHIIKSSFNKVDTFISFDTETYQGTCKLICRSDLVHEDEAILNPTFLQCLDFLFYNASKNTAFRTFYNMSFDLSAIFKILLDEINDKQKSDFLLQQLTSGIEIEVYGYKMVYFKPKLFILKKGKKSVKFTDISGFYECRLEEASQSNLHTGKLKDVDTPRLNVDLAYWDKMLKFIIKYCKRDARLTAMLTKIQKEAIIRAGIELPKLLCSSASITKHHFRKKCHIPSLWNVPKRVLELGMNTYFGGRFEVLKKGTFNQLGLWDIVSEYPAFTKSLPSFKYGLWRHEYEVSKTPVFGFYYVKIDIPYSCKIPTVPIKNHQGVLTFPVGKIEKWMTWYDLDLMRDYIVELIDAIVFIPNDLLEYYPFSDEIDKIVGIKTNLKNQIKEKKKQKLEYNALQSEYDTTKRIVNALYGCFVETNKNPDGSINAGVLYNPVYATFITAFGRWKIVKDIPEKYHDNICAFHTDSVILDIDISHILDIGVNLGQWEYEKNGKGLIIATGVYQIDNLVKTRGFKNKNVGDWFDKLSENELKTTIRTTTKRMLKIREALIRKDYSSDDINKMIEYAKKVDINSDNKRIWKHKFENCKEFLSMNIVGIPLECNFISDESGCKYLGTLNGKIISNHKKLKSLYENVECMV